jgi:hypothetical protein
MGHVKYVTPTCIIISVSFMPLNFKRKTMACDTQIARR